MMSHKIIIDHAWIITMNNKMDTFRDGYLILENTKIMEIGESTPEIANKASEEDVYIDAEGGILMPGMVNTHCHVSMIPFRSLGEDYKNRLRRFVLPLETKVMDKELIYQGARYGICEMLLAGITTFCDMYYFEEEVARAAHDLSIRAVLGETVIDMETCEGEEKNSGYAYAEQFIKNWEEDPLIHPIVAPHATYSVQSDMIRKTVQLAQQYNTLLTMHVSEMDFEIEQFEQEYGKTPVKFLEELGVLNSNFLFAHAIHVTAEDIEIMKNHDVKVAHCVLANMKSGKGIAPVSEMQKKGIVVGLGTDGPMSGNSLDFFTIMKMTAACQKTKYHDISILKAKEILKMATIDGARALHLEKETGSLEVGKAADIILIESDSINMFPQYDPYATIVYGANAGNVDTVIVNGRILVRHKKLTNTIVKKERKDLEKKLTAFYNIAAEAKEE